MYAQLMQLHSQDVRGAEMDRGLGLMASAFGTAQQQHDMMNYAMHTPQDDRVTAFGHAITDQAALREQQNQAGFQAGAAGLASQFGVSPDVMTELAKNPQALSTFLTGRMQMQNQMQEERNKDLVENQAGFNSADSRSAELERNQQWFQDHPQATIDAVRTPWLYSGPQSLITGAANTDAVTARAKLDQMVNQLSADNLKNSGMSRMAQQEFLKVGASATAINSLKDPQAITDEINRLADVTARTRANIQAQAGREVDAQHSGFADPHYFDKSNPQFTGATVAKGGADPGSLGTGAVNASVATVNSPADVQKLPSGSKFVIPDGPRKGQIAQVP
jgi:hypothetical protein